MERSSKYAATAGGLLWIACGKVRAGHYIDFRRDEANTRTGAPVKMHLQTAMQGMGVTREEYMQHGDGGGFGEFAGAQSRLAPFALTHNDTLPYFTR